VLRDHLMRSDDWDAAGHAYADEHNGYAGRLHTFHQWMTAMYLATGADADARRARAMPLIAGDPSRQPDAGQTHLNSPANGGGSHCPTLL